MNKQILDIALPAIVSNVTVPLLGLVDVAIVGHLGAAEYIGAIAIGSMIFNSIYWLFGFLRMSTSGLTAQAYGEELAKIETWESGIDNREAIIDNWESKIEDRKSKIDNRESKIENRKSEINNRESEIENRKSKIENRKSELANRETTGILKQALFLAFAAAFVILLLQWPLRELLLFLMNPAEEVRSLVIIYFNICVWGAPAVLGFFALNGWFIGMQDSRTPMKIAIGQNIFNICASCFFVFILGMKVEGVALGTLFSQWGAFLAAIFEGLGKGGSALFRGFPLSVLSIHRVSPQLTSILSLRRGICSYLKVSRDIFLRTLCLMSVTFFFTSAGSWQGTMTLAVNTLMMQLFLVYSYFTDSFAYAGEALAGRYCGAHDSRNLRLCIRQLFLWGMGVAAVFTLVYSLVLTPILSLLTNEADVLFAARPFAFWIAFVPAVGIAAFIWDGVFIGMTLTSGMLLTCALATAVFYSMFFLLFPSLGNHALWLAFVVFLLMRGVGQTVYFILKYNRFNRHRN